MTEQQPAYSQRVVEIKGVSFQLFACVNGRVMTPPMLVARALRRLGIPVKITSAGKNIDGEKQPPYLKSFREIWMGEEGMEVVGRISGLEMYRKSLTGGPVDGICEEVQRITAEVRAESKVESVQASAA